MVDAALALRQRICLLCILMAGCSRHVDVDIPFVATIRGVPFSCIHDSNGFVSFDLRFYVHDIELVAADGSATPVRVTDDGTWQQGGVALLDFEDGSGSCRDGTSGTHTVVHAQAPAGTYTALRFTVGVPFARNHADPAIAEPPLNLGRMHWGWQGGYKFFRFEGEGPQGAVRVHLGSTGCEGTIGDIKRCQRPNRAQIRIDGFVPGRNRVALELAPLLASGDGSQPNGTPLSCMSEVGDAGCRGAFAAFGLDLANGASLGVQHLFSSQPL